ncbi:MAG: hypothetical protein WC087_02010 [Candidatus Paceibacterota bacterium]
MDNDTQSIIKEQFKTLPPVIRDTITGSNWQEKIRRVVKNNNLHVDQGAAIENLVFITMLGIETPETFVRNAKEYAGVSDDQAYTISNEVEREIFGDIRRKLISITETADTVADVDREANSQLNRVAQDIESAVKINSKPSLKNKIPSDYFENKNETKDASVSPVTPPVPSVVEVKKEDPYKEPIPEDLKIPTIPTVPVAPEIPKTPITLIVPPVVAEIKPEPVTIKPVTPPKPIFIPMPKSVDTSVFEEKITPPNTTQPAKVDPYREPVA